MHRENIEIDVLLDIYWYQKELNQPPIEDKKILDNIKKQKNPMKLNIFYSKLIWNKNLFGICSYDNTPYESSFEFTDYSEGIETVAKSLVNISNPSETKIYDGETAAGWYYNGPTLSGVNTRYATDQDWHKKVYSYMELLYNRL